MSLVATGQELKDARTTVERLEEKIINLEAKLQSDTDRLNSLMQQIMEISADPDSVANSGILQNTVYYDTSDHIYRDFYGSMPPTHTALNVIGTMYVHGRIIIDGCLLINIDGKHVDMCAFVETMQASSTQCTNDCINGVLNFNCSCICFEGWTGQQCDINTCNGRGVWNMDTFECDCGSTGYDNRYLCSVLDCGDHGHISGQSGGWVGGIGFVNSPDADIGSCICDDGYFGDFCEDEDVQCPEQCKGECNSFGMCRCLPTQVGTHCQYNCSASGIMNNECFFNRQNLGIDRCYEWNETTVCVCGGGYNSLTQLIDIKAGICSDCTSDDMRLSLCCAPDTTCTQPVLCTSDTCCNSKSTQACLSSGCTLCNITSSIQLCTFQNIADYNCTTDIPVYVNWDTWVVDCSSGINNVICNELSRQVYLGIYETTTSLSDARSLVNAIEWPQLQITGTSDLGRAFSLSVLVSPFPCPYGYYVGVGKHISETNTGVMSVVCGNNINFWVGISVPENISVSEGRNLYFYDTDNVLKCLSDPTLDDNLFLSFVFPKFASVSPVQAIAIPVESSFFYCADISSDDEPFIKTVEGYILSMDTNSDLIWCKDCPPLYVSVNLI